METCCFVAIEDETLAGNVFAGARTGLLTVVVDVPDNGTVDFGGTLHVDCKVAIEE